MFVYQLPADLDTVLRSKTVPYFDFEDTDEDVLDFANSLNWHINALTPLPVVDGVSDEYIYSCLTIASKLSNLNRIDKAEFIRLFEAEMTDMGFSMQEKDLTQFYDYFLKEYKNGFE